MSGPSITRRQILIAGAVLVTGARAALAQDKTITVTIEDLEFSPTAIEAKAGTTIEWVNKDLFDHTATVDGAWDILIPAGATVSHVVGADDTVEYYCRFHPNMTGTITVTP